MRPPFFAFYPADFANDINVEAMSTLAVGAYILLLCKAWQSEPPGSLPNDDQILARLARVDAVGWAEVRSAVLACFELRPDGRLHQGRLRREYDAAVKRMKTAKESGRKGGKKTQQLAQTVKSQATLEGSLQGSVEGPLKGRSSPAQALEIGDSTSSSKKSGAGAPGGPGGGKKETNPLHKRAVDWFCARWAEHYGAKYPFARGKDADAVAFVLDAAGNEPERFKALVEKYLADPDPFVVGNRHDLGTLRMKLPRYLAGPRLHVPAAEKNTLEAARRLSDDSSGGAHPLMRPKPTEGPDAKAG